MNQINRSFAVGKQEIASAIRQAVKNKILRVDKISLLSGYDSPDDSKLILKQRLLKLKGDERYKVSRKNKDSKNYYASLTIRDLLFKERIFHISYDPIESPKQRLNYIRIEFSPQHYTQGQLEEIIDWLADESRLGAMIRKVFNRSVVSRVDIAFDVEGIRPRDMYIGLLKRYTGSVTYCHDGYIKSWRVGSTKSDTHVTVYEKMKEEHVEGEVRPIKDSEPYTRFEFRIWSNTPLVSIETITNPFKELKLYPRDIQDDCKIPKWFKALINHMPLGVALRQSEDDNERERIKNRIEKHLIDFDSDAIWAIWPQCIVKLNAVAAILTDQSHKL